MKLSLYHKKRNFKKTPEPKGKVSNKYKNLYIIQKHAASHLHYDFRLELNGVLLSWAIPKGPCLDPTVKRLAMHVEDHPVEYGSFEGIIPKGQYGGGTVMLWDKGSWISEDENPTAAYQKGHLRFQLKAKKLKGRFSLIRFKKEEKAWFLIKGKDKYAKSLSNFDITIEEPNSVLTHYNLEEIAENYQKIWGKKGLEVRKKIKKKIKKLPEFNFNLAKSPMPASISPQLATLADKAPSGNEWAHEIKLDGYRILAFIKNKKIKLMSRNNKEWTAHFSNVIKELGTLPIKNAIFDGEMVLLDKDQKSNFQLLQNAIDANEKKSFIYYIFDLLYYDQFNLMSLTLIERKNILHAILSPIHSDILRYSKHIIGNGEQVFKSACKLNLEGIISKHIDSSYLQKRTKNWLKTKWSKEQEFVIGGFTPAKGSRKYFGSLYLGYFKNNKLIYCGNVGTGFNEHSLQKISEQLQKLISPTNPFNTRPPGITSAIWVEPILIAEVEFTEWTQEGRLRHPSFKGLRFDKSPESIKREMIPMKKKSKVMDKPKSLFKLTNPDKILYQEDKISKLDLANYYEQIQSWILPFIIERPLTIVRCPDGYKECFYQKHINETTPKTLYGIAIKEKEKTNKCIYIKNIEGLLSLIQMGTLEIHPWGSRIEKVEYPDMLTIDLDPAPSISWKQVVATAQLIRDHFASLKLKSFVKTTGGKGLHIVIPFKPEYKWLQIKNFSHTFVQLLVKEYPNEYVGEMSKAKRKGKIFIDYLRNQRGATAIAPYSTRARKGAPVATPLAWDELTTDIRDTQFDIHTLPKRLAKLKKDPWHDFFKIKQSLKVE